MRRPASAGAARSELLLAASRHPLAAACGRGLAAARSGMGATEANVAETGRLALLVSGGGDSMALLLLMAAIRERCDPALDSLAVLSVDHGTRPEAAEECEAAIDLAARVGVARREVVRVAVDGEGNLLERARAARYAAARRFVDAHRCVAAVTAHTADDRAEGLLIGLRRGLGLAALVRPAPFAADARGDLPPIMRPLLSVRRHELREFLADLGVAWRDDPTNALHERGALRCDPSLAALVDGIARGAARAMDEARELIEFRDAAVHAQLAESRRVIPRGEFDALPRALHGALLRSMVHAAGGDLSQAVLDEARLAIERGDRAPRSFACAGGVELRIDARTVSVVDAG